MADIQLTSLTALWSGGDVNGDINLTGTGRRITADFSNSTFSSRGAFQTNVANGNTVVNAIPNGTGVASVVRVFGSSDMTNSAYAGLYIDATSVQIESSKSGTGTAKDVKFTFEGVEKASVSTVGVVKGVRIDTALNFTSTSTDVALSPSTAGNVYLRPQGLNQTTNQVVIASDGTMSVFGGTLEVGFRDTPRVTGGMERGKAYATSTGFTVAVGQAAGSTFSIYNDSASAITLTQGATLTMRLNGTATTGNRTLAARGMCTIWYNSTTECIISGAVT